MALVFVIAGGFAREGASAPKRLWTARDQSIASRLSLQGSRLKLSWALRNKRDHRATARLLAATKRHNQQVDAFHRYHNQGRLPGENKEGVSSGRSSVLFGGAGARATTNGVAMSVGARPLYRERFARLAQLAASLTRDVRAIDPTDHAAMSRWESRARKYNDMVHANKNNLAPAVVFPFVDHSTTIERLPLFDVLPTKPADARPQDRTGPWPER